MLLNDGSSRLLLWMRMQDPSEEFPNTCRNMELQGIMNITGPHSAGTDGPANATGPEILVSMPMFCRADQRLVQLVEGLECDMERHMTWLDVEPTTGKRRIPSTGAVFVCRSGAC